ncbi:MAG: LCP family protein [Acidimicrobiia bacterium]|nr:LCP family protein [Acidimicrobiia bacterium]
MRNRGREAALPLWRRTLLALLAAAALLALAEGYLLSHRLDRVDLDLARTGDGATTYLVVGTDSRAALGGFRRPDAFGPPGATPDRRADVIMVVRVPRRGRPTSVSIPRDLVVVGERGSPTRLTLVRQGGMQPLLTTLCLDLGVAPDHVVEISFTGLRDIVDALGGLVIDEPAPARDGYSQFSVPGGRRRIDGEMAVAYVRSRHMEHLIGGRWTPDLDGAAGRERRQSEVLVQLGRGARTALTNPVTAQRLAWRTTGGLTVSRSAGLVDLVRLGIALGRAETLRLAVERHDGEVPWARLTPAGRSLLERIAPPARASRGSGCPGSRSP